MTDQDTGSIRLLPPPGKLPELKQSFNETQDQLGQLRFEADEYSRRALAEAQARIEREVEERFGSREAALRERIGALETALEDEKDRLARAGIASAPMFANSPTPPPVGTVMIEDEESISRLRRPPRRAVVEIVNRDTFTNATTRLRVGLGDIVLRLLRKDGTPTDEFAPMDRYRWKPEG